MKQKVLIEHLDEGRVGVYNYYEETTPDLTMPVEVIHKMVAVDEYDVVGDIIDGSIQLYDPDDVEDDDYSDEEMGVEEDD